VGEEWGEKRRKASPRPPPHGAEGIGARPQKSQPLIVSQEMRSLLSGKMISLNNSFAPVNDSRGLVESFTRLNLWFVWFFLAALVFQAMLRSMHESGLGSPRITWQEIAFQLVLHGLVFSFYSFDKHHPQIQAHQVALFLSYALGSFVINYLLLPRFFYQKQYLAFMGWLLLVIVGTIGMEELVVEQIYFPETRAKRFPGVFFSLLGVLPVMAILSGFKFAWDALGKQKEVEVLRAAMQESELQFLTSQINPHFLFNNLNNLYAYAIEASPKTPTIILELSAVLRYMLYECKETFVPLQKELEQLGNFTRLSELQIEERGEVYLDMPQTLSTFQIAPLILVVFIENAFKHSQASQSDNIIIHIQVLVSEQGRLDFVCKNNFQEITNTDQLSHGIGLENVKKRLKLLYPHAHRLDIQTTEDSYEVHLSMQLTQIPLA
jgi:hypothetical protein